MQVGGVMLPKKMPLREKKSYFVRTMETASLRMLSPNTSMLSTGSTLRALKMAMVATGSTAEISEPKAKLGQVAGQCDI